MSTSFFESLLEEPTLPALSCVVGACREHSKDVFTPNSSLPWTQTNRKIKYLKLPLQTTVVTKGQKQQTASLETGSFSEAPFRDYCRMRLHSISPEPIRHLLSTHYIQGSILGIGGGGAPRTRKGFGHSMATILLGEKIRRLHISSFLVSVKREKNPTRTDLNKPTKSIGSCKEKYRGTGLKWGLIGAHWNPNSLVFWVCSPKCRLRSQILCAGKMASRRARSTSSKILA